MPSRAALVAALATVAALAALAATPTPARADIYKFVDENGVTHLADRPMGAGWRLIVRDKRRRGGGYHANQRRYGPLVDRVARRFALDRVLVDAVVRAESSYAPRAVSRKGAIGLMQLMPATARRYGVRDPYDPDQNLHGGVRYLRDLIIQFKDVVLALAAYNAGENAVARHGNRIPPYPETREYVRRVLTYYRELRTKGS